MIKVTIELYRWDEYKDNVWGGARTTLDDIEERGREEEAMDIIEEYFSEDVLGHISSLTELNDFLWFSLPEIMHLYDEDDNEEEEDEEYEEDEEEYEDDEEE